MDESLRKNPKFVRSSLLYEFFRGNPIFETYKNFCKVMGDDVMGYKEFECWYWRFEKGNYDLTWDSSSLSSNTLSLSDMPIEILQKIMKDVTWNEVIALRQVSSWTREIIDKTRLVYRECTIIAKDIITTLSIDGESEVFRATFPDDWEFDLYKEEEKTQRIVHKIAVLMKNPRVYFEKLVLDTRALTNILEQEIFDDYWMRVKTFCAIGHSLQIDCILELMEPKTLEEIELETFENIDIEDLAQWKQAKSLKIDTFDNILCEYIDHFARIDVQDCPLSVEMVIELKNHLVESSSFEKCCLRAKENRREKFSESDIDAIEEQLGSFIRKDSDDPNYRRYTIDKENEVFELKIGEKLFEMERIR